LELQAQQAKVRSRQQFVRREDLPGAIEKLQAQIRADEDELAKKSAQQAEAKAEVQSLQGQAAGLEEAAGSHKVALETKAAELKQLKKTLKLASEETGRAKARAGQIEGDLQQQRSQRQRTYQQARIEEVNLPQVYEAVERDSGSSAAKKRKKRSAAPDPAKPGGESVMLASELFSPNALVGTGTADGDAEDDGAPPGVADGQEQPVRIDFSVLDEGERQGDLRRLEQETEAELQELRRRQESMAPNMKAPQQFDEVSGRLASAENDFKALSSNTKNIRERADSVRKERKQRFLAAFEHIAHVIDGIYKDLTQVEGVPLGGSAFLTTLESDQEGGLPGISFQAMPAGKRIRPMSQLSGGERTLAALALLFAIHDYQPSPFFVMDEIDAALDNVNVTRVGAYIRERAEEGEVQFVVISLKDNFYEKAHGLVGIHRDRRLECSRTLTLDLTRAQGV
jgi:structural maintenance of chromosome 1